MTADGFRQLARLKMTPHEVNNFTPPQGLNITWHDYDYENGEVTANITGCSWNPEDTVFVYKEEVNHMLAKVKVAQDGIRSSRYPLPFIRKIDTFTSFIKGENDRLISKGETRDVVVNGQQLKEAQAKCPKVDSEFFYDERNRKRYKVQLTGVTI